MSISPQTGSNQSEARVDPLDQFALEIARRNKLEGESLQKLANIFPAGATTLHRKLKGWLEEGRFDLIDKWTGQPTTSQAAIAIDEPLGERLARGTAIRRARVARLTGVEAAAGDDYRLHAASERGQEIGRASWRERV